MSEKNCGTCGWWDKWRDENGTPFGHCAAPLPECTMGADRYVMRHDEGTTCPCWKERE